MPTTTRQTALPAAKERDPWLDNAKMALVTLVVLGHTWTLLPGTGSVDILYDFLYAWHVPAFVFVTGYLSRGFQWEKVRMWRLVRTVVVPYVVFESLLAVVPDLRRRGAARGPLPGPALADVVPLGPVLLAPAHPAVPPDVGRRRGRGRISLVAGLYAGDTLDMARVLGLLPFFVMGLKATPERLERLRSPAARTSAVVTMAADGRAHRSSSTRSPAPSGSTTARGTTSWSPATCTRSSIRALLLAVGTVGAIAFLALVPRVGGWFARMGAWTLVVYLFHGFFVKAPTTPATWTGPRPTPHSPWS